MLEIIKEFLGSLEIFINFLNWILPVITVLAFFILFPILHFSLFIRRAHDFNKDGILYAVLGFIPFVAIFIWLYVLVKEGDIAGNRFGLPNKSSVWENIFNKGNIFTGRLSRPHFLFIPILVILPFVALFFVYGSIQFIGGVFGVDAKKYPKDLPITILGNYFSIKIPSNYDSVCTWNYAEGNGAIPYFETTQASGSSNVHTVQNKQITEGAFDYSVSCKDKQNNIFSGQFPGDMEKKFNVDSKTQAVEGAFSKLNKYLSNNDLSYLNTLNGKYTFDIKLFENLVMQNRLKQLLGNELFNNFKTYWNVTSPIEVKDNIFIASGCQSHNCSDTNFTLVIDTYKNKMYVISKVENVKSYNFEDNNNVPQAIQKMDK